MVRPHQSTVENTAKAIAQSHNDPVWRNYLPAAEAAEGVLRGPIHESLSRVFAPSGSSQSTAKRVRTK
jgi:hypothetical protein